MKVLGQLRANTGDIFVYSVTLPVLCHPTTTTFPSTPHPKPPRNGGAKKVLQEEELRTKRPQGRSPGVVSGFMKHKLVAMADLAETKKGKKETRGKVVLGDRANCE